MEGSVGATVHRLSRLESELSGRTGGPCYDIMCPVGPLVPTALLKAGLATLDPASLGGDAYYLGLSIVVVRVGAYPNKGARVHDASSKPNLNTILQE